LTREAFAHSALAGVAKVYLQKVQSGVWVRRSEHITPVREDLHWLPVCQRVVFKTVLMVWKYVHGVALAYLSDLCLPATAISGRRHLRSAATGTWFHAPGLQLDNEVLQSTHQPHRTVMPPALRSPDLSESAFKRALKTHLFSTCTIRLSRYAHDTSWYVI